MLVVLSEDSFVDPNTINGRELRATVEAARMFGSRESALQFCDVAACFQDLRARFPNSVR